MMVLKREIGLGIEEVEGEKEEEKENGFTHVERFV
jgi:hypothetical protein